MSFRLISVVEAPERSSEERNSVQPVGVVRVYCAFRRGVHIDMQVAIKSCYKYALQRTWRVREAMLGMMCSMDSGFEGYS